MKDVRTLRGITLGLLAVSILTVIATDERFTPHNQPALGMQLWQTLPFGSDVTHKDPNFSVDNEIATYIDQVGFTDYAKMLFLDAQPEALSGTAFDEACSGVNAEPGIGILGCYYVQANKI